MDYPRLTPILASAVATQEATDEDSNWLPRRAFNAATVAIRKPADAGNGYREARRQEFTALLDAADNDPETTGVFLYLLAPRRGGLAREAVLCAGKLPVGATLARMIPACRKRLEQHAAAEAASR